MSNNKGQTARPEQVFRGRGGRGGGGGPFGGGMNVESPKNFKETAIRLFKYFGTQKIMLIIVIFLAIITTALRVIGPVLAGMSVDAVSEFIKNKSDIYIAKFINDLLVLLVVLIATWIFGALQGIVMTRITNKLIFRLRNDVFIHMQSLSMSYFETRGLGDIISRLTNDIEIIEQFLSNGIIELVGSVLSIVGYLIAMIILNPLLSLVVIVTVPLMIGVAGFIGKKVRQAFRESQAQVGKLSANIQESITAIRVIKTFNREEEEFSKFKEINHQATKVGEKAEIVAFAFMPVINSLSSITLALVVGFGGAMAFNGIISVGVLTSFILYSRRFLEPLRQVTNVYNLMQSSLAGAERVFTVLNTKSDIENKENAIVLSNIEGNVTFDNVRFGYLEDKIVLDGINLKADKGQVIAIVGPTGAGKTTLINLLMRYYDVWSGSILVDGIDIRDVDMNSLRTKMGVVLQEPFFFATTIRENLLYGNRNATEEDIINASKLANAHQFIIRLDRGYDTELSERGMNLSQGERQLLAIARAILSNPKILILDEATSNVDSLTEAHIQQGLLELMKNRTSFIIAHRLSTIKKANKVLVIHNHKIIEEGSHYELIMKNGFYARLYRMQLQKDMNELTESMEI